MHSDPFMWGIMYPRIKKVSNLFQPTFHSPDQILPHTALCFLNLQMELLEKGGGNKGQPALNLHTTKQSQSSERNANK